MSAGIDVGAYFPERSPTWLEVGGTLVAAAAGAEHVLTEPVSVPTAVVGFLLVAVAQGPAAASEVGHAPGQWFRDIGSGGRILAIVLFFAIVVVVSQFAWVPERLVTGAASGGLLAAALYVLAFVVEAGGVSGWTTDRTE